MLENDIFGSQVQNYQSFKHGKSIVAPEDSKEVDAEDIKEAASLI